MNNNISLERPINTIYQNFFNYHRAIKYYSNNKLKFLFSSFLVRHLGKSENMLIDYRRRGQNEPLEFFRVKIL